MPWKSKRMCGHPGCAETSHERFCGEHAKAQQTRESRWRGTAASRGYDAAWQRVRVQVLERDHYLCQECLKKRPQRVTVATSVHHVIKVKDAPDRRLDMGNLVSVCEACHEELEGQAGGYGGPKSEDLVAPDRR